MKKLLLLALTAVSFSAQAANNFNILDQGSGNLSTLTVSGESTLTGNVTLGGSLNAPVGLITADALTVTGLLDFSRNFTLMTGAGTNSTSTTLAALTELSTDYKGSTLIKTGSSWLVTCDIPVGTTLSTTGIKIAILSSQTSAPALVYAALTPSTVTAANTLYREGITNGATIDFAAASLVGVTSGLLHITGVFAPNADADIAFRFAVSSAGTVTVKSGAQCTWKSIY